MKRFNGGHQRSRYIRAQRKSFLQPASRASWSYHLRAQTSIFWWAELTSHFFCKLNSSKYFTCPLGKLRTEFTSPIAKSTSPGLSDTTFFVHCTCILGAWSPRGVSTYLFTEMPELLIQNSTFQMQSLFGSSYNLGQKVLRILYFLTHRTPIHRIGTAMAPPLAPPWSKLSSQDQKWSSWNSTFFFGGGGEREYL